jgi:hypothetical protein
MARAARMAVLKLVKKGFCSLFFGMYGQFPEPQYFRASL